MNNVIAIILTIALFADAAANLLRLRGVERTIRQQEELMRRGELEQDKRVDAATKVVETVALYAVAETFAKLEGLIK